MVRIISDSTCDLSPELVERYHISILPLNIVLGDTEYLDGVSISPDQIYAWSDAHKTTPKTSAPSMDGVSSILKPVLADGDEAVFFTISDKFSTCGNIIRMVVEHLEAEDKISVIDSMNLSTGIGLMVIEAAIWPPRAVPALRSCSISKHCVRWSVPASWSILWSICIAAAAAPVWQLWQVLCSSSIRRSSFVTAV